MWKFLKSCKSHDDFINSDNIQYVFWGRSNVGKSSLINSLASCNIAKTSSYPGRTQLINYFESNKNKIIIDLPGYGYAKISKKLQDKISFMIDFYFKNDKNNKKVLLLIDAKIGFSASDLEIIEYFNDLKIKFDIVVTKIDKANQSQRYCVKNQALSLKTVENIFLVSSEKKQGIEEIMQFYDL